MHPARGRAGALSSRSAWERFYSLGVHLLLEMFDTESDVQRAKRQVISTKDWWAREWCPVGRSAARHTLGRAATAALRQRGARGGGAGGARPELLHPRSAHLRPATEKRDISRRRPPSNFPPRIRSMTLVLHKHATLHIILSFVSYDSISIGIIKINGSSVIRQTFSFGNHRLTNH